MVCVAGIAWGEAMAKISINAAAKAFAVSRPTILKHLNNGKISGEKDTVTGHWIIDESELARVYCLRGKTAKGSADNYTSPVSDLDSDLHAKIERLERELAVAEALAEDRKRLLDQSMKALEAPKRRKWRFW